MITWCDSCHRSPYRLNNPRTFVAQHDRQWRWEKLIAHDHVSVANTCSDYTDAHFIGTRNAQFCTFELQLTTGFTQYGNFDLNGCKGALGHLLILFNVEVGLF